MGEGLMVPASVIWAPTQDCKTVGRTSHVQLSLASLLPQALRMASPHSSAARLAMCNSKLHTLATSPHLGLSRGRTGLAHQLVQLPRAIREGKKAGALVRLVGWGHGQWAVGDGVRGLAVGGHVNQLWAGEELVLQVEDAGGDNVVPWLIPFLGAPSTLRSTLTSTRTHICKDCIAQGAPCKMLCAACESGSTLQLRSTTTPVIPHLPVRLAASSSWRQRGWRL